MNDSFRDRGAGRLSCENCKCKPERTSKQFSVGPLPFALFFFIPWVVGYVALAEIVVNLFR